MNVNEAIAAVKANRRHPDSPMPWKGDYNLVLAADGSTVCDSTSVDAAHIAAAVNAAPVLIAEVERLRAVVEALAKARLPLTKPARWGGRIPDLDPLTLNPIELDPKRPR